jgi:hypothetical protein
MTVISRGKYCVARFNNTGIIHLNTSTLANAANNAGETVGSMTLSRAIWNGANNNGFSYARGANTVHYFMGTGSHDFQGMIMDDLGGEASSNVIITKIGSGTVSLVLSLHKKVTIT